MRVLFLTPPLTHHPRRGSLQPAPAYAEAGRSLAFDCLAAYLLRHAPHEVLFLDARQRGLSYEELETELMRLSADVVALSMHSFGLVDVARTAALAHRCDPGCKVVVGGPHVGHYPLEITSLPGVDYVIAGEGDVVFAQLVHAISVGRDDLHRICGLSWTRGSCSHISRSRAVVADLDRLPLPVPQTPESIDACRRGISTGRHLYVQTSRGCPFSCTFCSVANSGHRFRATGSVVRELEWWVDHSVSDFFFVDDAFASDQGRILRLCRELARREWRIGFKANARVDLVNPRVLGALKSAGCSRLYYGVESGVQAHLDELGKGVFLDQVRQAFAMTHQVGIESCAYLMIGIPGETRDDIERTFEFAASLQASQYRISIFEAYPGTQIYERRLAEGHISRDYWRDFSAHPDGSFRLPAAMDTLSHEELEVLRSEGRMVLTNGRLDDEWDQSGGLLL